MGVMFRVRRLGSAPCPLQHQSLSDWCRLTPCTCSRIGRGRSSNSSNLTRRKHMSPRSHDARVFGLFCFITLSYATVTEAAVPVLTSAVSRRTHTGVVDFDITLPLTVTST